MTKEQAIALGWTVEYGFCLPYDDLPKNGYILTTPNGEEYEGDGTGYGWDFIDETEDEAWARLEFAYEGQHVICWGVGCDKNGEPGVIIAIDHSKPNPYRIKIDRFTIKQAGWYKGGDFRLDDPPTASEQE